MAKPEPIMLLVLPIVPSHNFYPLFLFYSHAITLLYSLNFYCVSDNKVHSSFSS